MAGPIICWFFSPWHVVEKLCIFPEGVPEGPNGKFMKIPSFNGWIQ
jgi:hypothetical protein